MTMTMTMTLADTRGVAATRPPRFAGYAALFDIPDEGGDTIRRGAFVASLAALKARIANFKVPKRVFVVADLPRNAMGKVQKNVLRQEHAKLFV